LGFKDFVYRLIYVKICAWVSTGRVFNKALGVENEEINNLGYIFVLSRL